MWHIFAMEPELFILLAALAGAGAAIVMARLASLLLRHIILQSAAQADLPGLGWSGVPAGPDMADASLTPVEFVALAIAAVAAFAVCAWRFGPAPIALCAMLLCGALIVLAWVDYRASMLPDIVTLPLLWLGLLVNLQTGFVPLPQAVLGVVGGYGFLWLLFHVFRFFTGRDGMGYGDFKLLAALGAWLGVAALPALLLAASIAGVVVGLLLRRLGRAERWQELPFGPYLVAAGLITLYVPGLRLW
jgi:leader peptidase (prepilin peptidase)/N-methyltransferase